MTFVVEEPLADVAYLHDGSLEGLLSAVFLSYERHEEPTDIVREAVERGSGQEPDAEREWLGHEDEIKRKFGL